MPPGELFVDKTTGTPADTLLTFGLAHLLDRVMPLEDGGIQLRIEDMGDAYRLSLGQPLPEEWLREASFEHLFRGLDTAKKQADLPPAQRVDYLRHQENNRVYYEALTKKLSTEELAAQGITPPVADWPGWAIVNQMSAVDAYNSLAELWYAHRDCFPALLEIIVNLFAERPNEVEAAEAAWKRLAKEHGIEGRATAARLQVVNPGMGKGGNRGKADGLTIGGLDGFWVLEYLKYAGLFQAAVPRTVKGSKDRKTYILYPRDLSWTRHRQVFPEFQRSLFGNSAIKMDVLATLGYCRVFLEQWKAGQAVGRFAHARGNPGDHVAALGVVYYKHLGSAHATMNLSTLVLPLWLPEVESVEQVQLFSELLNEHSGVVRGLPEEHSEAHQLLHDYRDFLSGRDLDAFYRFTRGYAGFVMRKLAERGPSARQFTINHLEVLIMAHNRELSPILEDPGFRHVAEAIRRSTVIPQYQRAQGRETLYEIRYGLGDKLLRHAQYADEFIRELSRFMHDYNHENARKSETRKQQFRSNLTIDDVSAIVALVDDYGSPTVANLLVAFGYARDPKLSEREMPVAVSEATELPTAELE